FSTLPVGRCSGVVIEFWAWCAQCRSPNYTISYRVVCGRARAMEGKKLALSWAGSKGWRAPAAISESDQSGVEVRAYLALFLIGWGRCRDRAHFRTRVPSGISACKRRRYGQAVG